MSDVYEFEITIRFRVETDNKHDAMRAMLNTESSLNRSSIHSSHGSVTVMRSKAPTLRRHFVTQQPLPEHPAARSPQDEYQRWNTILAPLKRNWHVKLRWQDGREYEFDVTKPTHSQAIEEARLQCYHKHSHMGSGLTLISIEETA